MERYKTTKIKSAATDVTRGNLSGKYMRYMTTYYDEIPMSNNDIYVITQESDRLDLLAHQFYNDATLWWYIAHANNLKFMNLTKGQTIRIPSTLDFAKGS